MRQDYEKFVAVVTRLIELVRVGRTAEAHSAQIAEAQPLADSLERLTNQLVNKAESDVVSGIDESGAAYRASRLVVIGFAVGAIALALLLGRTISWSLVGRSARSAPGCAISPRAISPNMSASPAATSSVLATNLNRTSNN